MPRYDRFVRERTTSLVLEVIELLPNYSKDSIGELIDVTGKHVRRCAANKATLRDERAIKILEAIVAAGRNRRKTTKQQREARSPGLGPLRVKSGTIEINDVELEMWAQAQEKKLTVRLGRPSSTKAESR